MTERIDLSSTSVIVSLMLDSPDRLDNLERLRSYYAHFGDGGELRVAEQGGTRRLEPDPASGFHPVFLRDSGFHWKTRNMNHAARLSRRRYFLMSDCDVVPHPDALADGLARLERGTGFVQIYNGVVVDLSREFAATARDWNSFFDRVRSYDPARVDPADSGSDPDQSPLYGNANYRAVGGCFLCRRGAFFRAGGWNENFVSYGFEDREFDHRIRTLGATVARIEGHNLYHFRHARGPDSRYAAFYRQNEAEFARVCAMSPGDLQAYADRGFRTIVFDRDRRFQRVACTDHDGWRVDPQARIDLSRLAIVVRADIRTVAYGASCLRAFMDYLESGFRDYDLRLCEVAGTGYKHIDNKLNVVYRSFPDDLTEARLAEVLADAGRPLAHVLDLTQDAPAQLARITAPFERITAGTPVEALFGPATDPVRHGP